MAGRKPKKIHILLIYDTHVARFTEEIDKQGEWKGREILIALREKNPDLADRIEFSCVPSFTEAKTMIKDQVEITGKPFDIIISDDIVHDQNAHPSPMRLIDGNGKSALYSMNGTNFLQGMRGKSSQPVVNSLQDIIGRVGIQDTKFILYTGRDSRPVDGIDYVVDSRGKQSDSHENLIALLTQIYSKEHRR